MANGTTNPHPHGGYASTSNSPDSTPRTTDLTPEVYDTPNTAFHTTTRVELNSRFVRLSDSMEGSRCAVESERGQGSERDHDTDRSDRPFAVVRRSDRHDQAAYTTEQQPSPRPSVVCPFAAAGLMEEGSDRCGERRNDRQYQQQTQIDHAITVFGASRLSHSGVGTRLSIGSQR